METNLTNAEALASFVSMAQWAMYALGAVLAVVSTLFAAQVLATAHEKVQENVI
jgi:hypothetical protein